MVQGISMDSTQDPTTLKTWENHFHNMMAHLGHIKNAFEAVMYIIYTVFPTVENFNSWRMENKANAMEEVSKALQDLNDIKAIFNECQNPDRWKQDIKTPKSFSKTVQAKIANLLWMVQNEPALKGIAGSVITQLKVMTHASSNPGMWYQNQGKWEINENDRTWWDGTKQVSGTFSSYLEWMWCQEWQGRNPIPSNTYGFSISLQNGKWLVYGSINGVNVYYNYLSDFEALVRQRVNEGKPILGTNAQTQSPIYESDGQVKYWNGSKWMTSSKGDYINWVMQQIALAQQSERNNPKIAYEIEIQRNAPFSASPANNPKFTTGPTSQAFDAISTTFNSQSSEDQSKFKYLQSNMEQYLGIENSTMTQIIKQEENITGFTKQQSN